MPQAPTPRTTGLRLPETAPAERGHYDAPRLGSEGLAAVTQLFEQDRHRLELFVQHRTDPRLLSRLDWDDVLQEAFLVIQQRYHDYLAKPNVPFYIWMRTITHQVLIDLHRKHFGTQQRSIHREISLSEGFPRHSSTASLERLLAGSVSTPSCAVMRREQWELVRKHLASMSAIDREILMLRHREQLTNGEVAHVLGIDKSAATKRYFRALGRLREGLPQEDD